MTASSAPTTVYLKDYKVPPFLISEIVLDIDLVSEESARIRSTLTVERNAQFPIATEPLQLDVDELAVESVAIDTVPLASDQYRLDDRGLEISTVPDAFRLETVSQINPKQNTKLMGLYTSSTGFFTLCEAEGFRRITPFLDRPDVMARYTVTLHADRERYPILLANGNLLAEGEDKGGRHWATWEDPFPKPSYLFAIVAAKLDKFADAFVTRSGRKVLLQFFAEPGKLDQGTFAIESLKHAMKWDEDIYGLEVDLDQYNVVAVGDFNAGAMENKGLNVFNTKLVLARSDISTDFDFKFIDRTVAHEYFHNWTGNRVTCRDWFQLSLKEGLTVFREQQYAGDRYSPGVERIQTVRNLRSQQFLEDAGPMAHPVRPQSYQQISNFYTPTVYSKGAEVVRMIHTLLGPATFRKGVDLYFERHDGHAVTTDELVQAMQDASCIDLTQFKRWYEQSGTPRLEVRDNYDPASRVYELRVTQTCPPTPGQPEKLSFHLPFAVGLLNAQGQEIPLQLDEESAPEGTSRILSLRRETEVFRFVQISEPPVPSLGRNFSAPVIINYDYTDDQLVRLQSFDSDAFNRWEAGQRLAMKLLLQGIADHQSGRPIQFPDAFARAFGRILADSAKGDAAFAAEALALPAENYIGEQIEVVDPDAIHRVRQALRRHLADVLRKALRTTYDACTVTGSYRPDAESAGRRSLRNLCLAYLMERDDPDARRLCDEQLNRADNMTDALSALTSLANCDCQERVPALARFYEKWQDEPLAVDKWLGVQAASRLPGTTDAVRQLTTHPAFDLKNPNKVYALIGTFAGNQVNFHAADGTGYAFMAEQIVALDSINPQVAARMTRNFERWKRFDPNRQELMKAVLERLAKLSSLSKETAEVVTKALF
ncbi:aminopeptidase N [Bradyrhizobium sp. McL0615]|uniref:aminopeptidase N n=1 Tax=Bradyrhizobium sp. McL0615 TaxID=3415673 RepID=UPI003CF953CD